MTHPEAVCKSPIRFVILLLIFQIILFTSSTLVIRGHALRIESVQVPAAVTNGSQVSLICLFDLERDQLYSVKWYRNYVEFYRFQPQAANLGPDESLATASFEAKQGSGGGATQNDYFDSTTSSTNETSSIDGYHKTSIYPNSAITTPTSAGSSSTSYQAGSAKWGSASKFEFELEGINLNLHKSNASHVYLRHVTLASEGMYKCEVSSDSPSFVTVSAEHQMKVYALPKNRLTIVEHSNRDQIKYSSGQMIVTPNRLNTNANNNQRDATTNIQITNNQISKYQLNDLVNLTCIASASYPPAQLTWFINDQPITNGKPQSQNTSSISQYFQLLPSTSIKTSKQKSLDSSMSQSWRYVPIESRLTLAFRLDPKLLVDQSSVNKAKFQGFNLVNLACRAKMKISYQSEASILLSGGQDISPNANNNGKHHHLGKSGIENGNVNQLPKPSSLASSYLDTEFDHGKIQNHNPHQINYRWPSITSSTRINSHQHESSPSSTIENSLIEYLHTEQLSLPSQFVLLLGSLRQPQSSSLVQQRWTRNEFVDQVNMISSLLRQMQPNELENPLIQASSVHSLQDAELNGDVDTRELDSESNYLSSAPSGDTQQHSTANVQKLTCIPRLGRSIEAITKSYFNNDNDDDGDASGDGISQEKPAIFNFRWLINKQELKTNQVNDFDTAHGFYKSIAQPTTIGSSPVQRISVTRSNSSGFSRTSWSTRHMEMTSSGTMDDGSNQQSVNYIQKDHRGRNDTHHHDQSYGYTGSNAHHEQQSTTKNNKSRSKINTNDDTLWIELSPSILQLKELEVVCQTIIDQTMIEYETQVTIAYNLKDNYEKPVFISPQIPRGYLSPTTRVKNHQSDPSKLHRNNKIGSDGLNRSGSRTPSSSGTSKGVSRMKLEFSYILVASLTLTQLIQKIIIEHS